MKGKNPINITIPIDSMIIKKIEDAHITIPIKILISNTPHINREIIKNLIINLTTIADHKYKEIMDIMKINRILIIEVKEKVEVEAGVDIKNMKEENIIIITIIIIKNRITRKNLKKTEKLKAIIRGITIITIEILIIN